MSKDATDTGVSTEEVEVPVNPRDAIMADVQAKRNDELRSEGVEVPEEEVVIPAEEDEVVIVDDLGTGDDLGEDDLNLSEADLDAKLAEGLEPVKIKVDGEEVVVSVEDQVEYKKGLQKGYAAEKRFDEAAGIRTENEQTSRDLAEREALVLARENLQGDQEELSAEEETEIDDLFTELQDAVLTEDKEKGREVLKKLRPKAAAPGTPVTAEAINKAADVAQSNADYRKELATAQTTFSEEFPELDGSPMLRENVNQECSRIHEEDKSQSPLAILRKAGEAVRKEIGFVVEPGVDEDKLNLKREVGSKGRPAPAAHSQVHKPKAADEDPPPQSRKEVVADTVASRTAKLSGATA